MREIKFRAWDIDKQKYITCFDMSNEGCVWTQEPCCSPDYPDAIIEQYTGLKDKNGKEIYEGDIVQIDDHILGDFKIVWHGLGWKIKRAVGYETLSVHKSQDCTVIGNIHENPELLEQKG